MGTSVDHQELRRRFALLTTAQFRTSSSAVGRRCGSPTRPFAALECPTVYVVGTGAHSGATEEKLRTMRAAAAEAEAEASNKRVSVFATTPYNHLQILNKAPDTVVAAIEDVIHQSS